VEGVVMNQNFWTKQVVLVTGHTGFKGSWLSLWLQKMGASVIGYSLDPPTEPNFFSASRVASEMVSVYGDVRDEKQINEVFQQYLPNIVFHLAAQSLVRKSYREPLETFEVNVMGTANVLQAARSAKSVKAIVVVTSDKCYENREWLWAYRENEPMGGYDPYSSSKGCAELVTSAFRRSFFYDSMVHATIATARAGNVIGGGDWAEDRLIPDCIRALTNGLEVVIRNPKAIRPWQHVLEPLHGYLVLAEKLVSNGNEYGEGWNFGPRDEDAQSVENVTEQMCRLYGNHAAWRLHDHADCHEARLLRLDCSKAQARLGWRSIWNLSTALEKTIEWYKAYYDFQDMKNVSYRQIEDYERKLSEKGE